MEVLFQLVLEIVVQIAGEALAEAGIRSLGEPFRKPPNPWLASLGYAIFGALAGAVSLAIVPQLVHSESLRLLTLALAPLAAGIFMVCMGAWRARRGEPLLRIDRFAYAYLFALTFALVRFAWAA
jgi:hypothetical protein